MAASNDMLGLVVVGAGPSALCALHAAKMEGLSALAVDKGPVCGALVRHPTFMRWFSTSDKLELGGFPLLTSEKNPTRQEYLAYCRSFVKYFGLEVATYRTVTGVARDADGVFTITAEDAFKRPCRWRARHVLMATGFYDNPRMLKTPGEELPHVSHRYSEAHFYADHTVCVIGGGSSAAEVALELWRRDAHVTVVMRDEKFRTKYWVEPDIENRIAEGSIVCHRNADVCAIRPDDVEIVCRTTGKRTVIPADFVLAMTGYEPDTSLLEQAGAAVDKNTGRPVLSEHFESTVPGLYVAGTLTAGYDANVVFIENSRNHGPAVVRHILARRASRV